jgi:NAD(P)-dependent dehydrogenase (short-subunit alcohol dehydrogenase family)
MRAQKTGHVVNITASMTNRPFAGLPAALCSLRKGGLERVTRALAIEYAGDGIRFNAIAPGVVNTPMHSPAAHDFLRPLSPLGRMAKAEEVTEVVLYFESAHFINGEVVHLDGGRMPVDGSPPSKSEEETVTVIQVNATDGVLSQAQKYTGAPNDCRREARVQ